MPRLNIDVETATKKTIRKDAKKAGFLVVKDYVLSKLGVLEVEKKAKELAQ